MQDQNTTADGAVSTAEATLPAAQVTELFQLIDRMVGEEQVEALTRQKAEQFKLSSYDARLMAGARQADRVSALLAGLLSGVGEGEPAITEAGLKWAIERAGAGLLELREAHSAEVEARQP